MELPFRVEPFWSCGWELRDTRDLGQPHRGQAMAALQEHVHRYPVELLCDDDGLNREAYLRTLAGDDPDMRKFASWCGGRTKVPEMLGEYKPLTLALLDGVDVVGAYQWYGIRALRRDQDVVSLYMRPFPALPIHRAAPRVLATLMFTVAFDFLRRSGWRAPSGLLYKVGAVGVSTCCDPARGWPQDDVGAEMVRYLNSLRSRDYLVKYEDDLRVPHRRNYTITPSSWRTG